MLAILARIQFATLQHYWGSDQMGCMAAPATLITAGLMSDGMTLLNVMLYISQNSSTHINQTECRRAVWQTRSVRSHSNYKSTDSPSGSTWSGGETAVPPPQMLGEHRASVFWNAIPFICFW
jgi:hypothetical protein